MAETKKIRKAGDLIDQTEQDPILRSMNWGVDLATFCDDLAMAMRKKWIRATYLNGSRQV